MQYCACRKCLPALTLLLTILYSSAQTPGSFLRYYNSAIDDSRQKYGLYIPDPYDNNTKHPAVFNMHPFGGEASSSFSAFQKSYADSNAWVLVQLDGRGNTFYDGAGEKDLFNVLDEIKKDLNLDESRLYLEGCSMGGTGALRQGFRHPDYFAAVAGAAAWTDYALWHKHWYARLNDSEHVEELQRPLLEISSPLYHAENARNLPVYLIYGTADSTVWPQNGQRLDSRLTELNGFYGGFNHLVYEHSGGHCAGYDLTLIYDYLNGKTLNPYEPHVLYKTNQLKYGRAYWVRIEALRFMNVFGLIEANASGETVYVSTENVSSFTLFLDDNVVNLSGGGNASVVADGIPAYVGPNANITLYAVYNSSQALVDWSEQEPSSLLRKNRSLEGPLGDAFTSPFILLYGTRGNSSETEKNLNEANYFRDRWNSWVYGNASVKADVNASPSELQEKNIILFGSNESNTLINSIQDSLPIVASPNGVFLRDGSGNYSGDGIGLWMIYPNPLSSYSTYVVVVHRIVDGFWEKEFERFWWYWPDYVVFDEGLNASDTVNPNLWYLTDTFLDAGYFNSTWGLSSYAGDGINESHSQALPAGWNLFSLPLDIT